jgi:transposase
MASIALERSDVIVGVDTHKDQHVAVALDGLGGDLDDRVIVATNDGYAELVAWALGLGRVVASGSRVAAPTESVLPGSCAAKVTR